MNFRNMPELSWRCGYAVVAVVALVIVVIEIIWLRKNFKNFRGALTQSRIRISLVSRFEGAFKTVTFRVT